MIVFNKAIEGVVKRIGRSAVKWTGRGWSIWSAYPMITKF